MSDSKHSITGTPRISLDDATERRLEALAKQSKRSKSFLAAEAITAYVESEEWQRGEILAGLEELDAGQGVGHEIVSTWLRRWSAV